MSLTMAKKIPFVPFQTYELLDAMEKDSGVKLDSLCVDGGVTKADTLLNIMAGLLTRCILGFTFFDSFFSFINGRTYIRQVSSHFNKIF